MAPRSRSLTRRIRDQIGFSLVAVLVLFMVLRVFGVRSSVAGLVLSVVLTLALNVGLSYIGEQRARSARRREHDPRARGDERSRTPRGGGDIRWRDGDR